MNKPLIGGHSRQWCSPQSIRDAAFYNDPIEGRIDLFQEIEQGRRLPEKGLKQLDHAFDLAKFQTSDPAERDSVDTARSQLRDVLGQNDFARHLAETAQDPVGETFEYKGTAFPKAQGPVLMRKEHDFFADRDRFMTPPEIKQLDKKLQEESPPLQIAQADNGPPNPTNTPIGSRPRGESGAGYQFIGGAAERHARHKTARQEALEKQRREEEYRREKLKKYYGNEAPDPEDSWDARNRVPVSNEKWHQQRIRDIEKQHQDPVHAGYLNGLTGQPYFAPPKTEEEEELRRKGELEGQKHKIIWNLFTDDQPLWSPFRTPPGGGNHSGGFRRRGASPSPRKR